MPSYSAPDLVTLRSFPQTVRRYLSVAPRISLFNCQVTGTPPRDAASNGLFRFNYDNASGVSGLTAIGMTVDIGTALGDRSIGSVRMRNALDSTRVAIEEVAFGKVPIEDNHYASIIDEFLPAPKLPRLVGIKNNAGYVNSFTEYHDYGYSYSNQNTNIQPQANITQSNATMRKPTPAGWIDTGQTYRTMTFSSHYSFAMKTSATITSKLWNMKDGTYTVGTSTSTNVTVRFPVGFRIISLTVTDSSGTTHTQYFPVWVHDSSYPPITAFKVTSDNRDEGREMAFEIFGADNTADLDVIPKFSTVCYWEDAAFDGEDPPVEYIDSFLGWATAESTTLKLHDRSSMTLNVGGIAHWLSTFPGFGQKISHASTVNRWFKMQNITIDRMVHYILREYTTALSICNFYISGDTTTVRSEEIKKSDIWNQCVEMAKGNYSSFVADSLNGLWIRQHYSYLELADRTDVDIIANLSSTDWTDSAGLQIDETYPDRVSIVSGTGSYVNNNKNRQIYSRAPGLVPAHSGGNEEAPYQRLIPGGLVSQQKLNALTGHHYARVNNPRSEVSFALKGNLDIFEKAWGEPITITWTEENIRGLVVNTSEFLVTKVSVTHSNEFGTAPKKITLTLEEATVGEPGETYTPPGLPPNNFPPVTQVNFPGLNFPTFSPAEWYNIPPAAPKLSVVTSKQFGFSERYYKLEDTQSNGIEWTENGLPAFGGDMIHFKVDPFSPLYLGTGSTVNGWAVTDDTFVRITDLFGTANGTITENHPVTFVQNILDQNKRNFVASRVTQNFLLSLNWTYDNFSGTWQPYICRTTDGVNWAYDTSTLPPVTGVSAYPESSYFIDISSHVPGLAYISGEQNASGVLYETTDYGATWADITAEHPQLASSSFRGILHVPHAANPNSRRFYFADHGTVGVLAIPNPDPPFGFLYSLLEPVTSGNVLYYYDMDTHTATEIKWPGVRLLAQLGTVDEVEAEALQYNLAQKDIFFYYEFVDFQTCDTDPNRIAAIMYSYALDIEDEGEHAGELIWDYANGSTVGPLHTAFLCTSKNGGKTWQNGGQVANADSVRIATSSPNFLYIHGNQMIYLPSGHPSIPYPGVAYIAVSNDFGKTIVEGSRNLVEFTGPSALDIQEIFGGL